MLPFLVLQGLKHLQPFWVDCCVCQINKQGVENWVPSCSSLKQNIWHPQFWKKNAHSSRVFRCFSVVPVALCLFVWSHLNRDVPVSKYHVSLFPTSYPRSAWWFISMFSFTLPLIEDESPILWETKIKLLVVAQYILLYTYYFTIKFSQNVWFAICDLLPLPWGSLKINSNSYKYGIVQQFPKEISCTICNHSGFSHDFPPFLGRFSPLLCGLSSFLCGFSWCLCGFADLLIVPESSSGSVNSFQGTHWSSWVTVGDFPEKCLVGGFEP